MSCDTFGRDVIIVKEKTTSCVMLLPICSSVVVVTDCASAAPLFSLLRCYFHISWTFTKAAIVCTSARFIRVVGGGGGKGGTTCFWFSLFLNMSSSLKIRMRNSTLRKGTHKTRGDYAQWSPSCTTLAWKWLVSDSKYCSANTATTCSRKITPSTLDLVFYFFLLFFFFKW